jgi:glycine/D-amino acid oxidase-like deaminating enzyme
LEKRFPTLEGTEKVDLAIIGGGIAGGVLVETFAKRGMKVALLEKGRVASQHTGQMGGLVTRALDASYSDLLADLGRQQLKKLSVLSRRGLRSIQFLARHLNCDYKPLKSHFVSYRDNDLLLRKEWAVLQDLDPEVRFIKGPRAKMLPSACKEAIVFDKEGSLDIRRFVLALSKRSELPPN